MVTIHCYRGFCIVTFSRTQLPDRSVKSAVRSGQRRPVWWAQNWLWRFGWSRLCDVEVFAFFSVPCVLQRMQSEVIQYLFAINILVAIVVSFHYTWIAKVMWSPILNQSIQVSCALVALFSRWLAFPQITLGKWQSSTLVVPTVPVPPCIVLTQQRSCWPYVTVASLSSMTWRHWPVRRRNPFVKVKQRRNAFKTNGNTSWRQQRQGRKIEPFNSFCSCPQDPAMRVNEKLLFGWLLASVVLIHTATASWPCSCFSLLRNTSVDT